MLQLLHRVSGRAAAALLALSIAGPVLATVPAPVSCCCHRTHERCHCRICEHARELESGLRHFQQCGESHFAAKLPALPDVLPPLPVPVLPLPAAAPARRPLFSPAEPISLEVRTPPPLA